MRRLCHSVAVAVVAGLWCPACAGSGHPHVVSRAPVRGVAKTVVTTDEATTVGSCQNATTSAGDVPLTTVLLASDTWLRVDPANVQPSTTRFPLSAAVFSFEGAVTVSRRTSPTSTSGLLVLSNGDARAMRVALHDSRVSHLLIKTHPAPDVYQDTAKNFWLSGGVVALNADQSVDFVGDCDVNWTRAFQTYTAADSLGTQVDVLEKIVGDPNGPQAAAFRRNPPRG